ncbi:hypothetical protein B0H12DRAFT_96422 [Mycena haematopus]|nr:hypothetical protein B0H12DRAFT_96422 [Mycena haematopus]
MRARCRRPESRRLGAGGTDASGMLAPVAVVRVLERVCRGQRRRASSRLGMGRGCEWYCWAGREGQGGRATEHEAHVHDAVKELRGRRSDMTYPPCLCRAGTKNTRRSSLVIYGEGGAAAGVAALTPFRIDVVFAESVTQRHPRRRWSRSARERRLRTLTLRPHIGWAQLQDLLCEALRF